ncbi:DUF445 domain-containing protein [Desulfosporosinus sp. OT]|uniref:DUF445 domain-containing protein n=1 Tax=Desulfosporosinus sp. OT TaxID=913865 RepID=UPI000223A41C|nr:DUF445 domain-containing protein [Desulfosporosinus sp. OT]EGW39948.1 hypothetical protein DOT_2148 [Desulfosporosinus sp. OT]
MAKRINNTRVANLTLGGITLGFLISYPFHGSFAGGLISSGCSAGMIGGLADWFAVTALFRRPLGIRSGKILRTEIIPQNRDRIFSALADMVQNELLSQDLLQRKLSAWDFSGVLIRVFGKQEVKLAVGLLLTDLAEDMVNHVEPDGLKRQIQGLFQQNIDNLNLSQTLAEVIRFSVEHGDVDQLLKVICQASYEFVDQIEVSDALTDMMEAALTRYGENNPARKLVEKFLPAPSVLAHGLQEKVKTALQDGTVEQWLKDSLLHFVVELKTKSSLQERVDRFFLTAVTRVLENRKVKGQTAGLLRTSSGKLPAMLETISADLRGNWDEYLGRLEHNLDLRLKVDEEVKNILQKRIGHHHNIIGRMVREGLDPLTDDMLVELIEDKAGNDLQMIRINGSIVGSLAGMLIYLLGMVLR